MQRHLARLFLPALLAVCACTPSYSQDKDRTAPGDSGITKPHKAPPRLKKEARPPRPGPNQVWIHGYWEPRKGDWSWTPGRWEAPPHQSSKWVHPVYRNGKDGYDWEEGHWHH